MERSIVAVSTCKNREIALEEVFEKLPFGTETPKLVVFFSDLNNFAFFADRLKHFFPSAEVIGSTTYKIFSSELTAPVGIEVLAVYSDIECSTGVIFEVKRYPLKYKKNIAGALEKLSSTENTCCLEFVTAFSNCEENVLDTFFQVLGNKNIPVIGSSAGSEQTGTCTMVSLNGEVFEDACVFVLIHNLSGKIFFYKENVFKPTDIVLVPTDVDCEERTVYEYDHVPALERIKKVTSSNTLKGSSYFTAHSVGRIVNGEIFITEGNQVLQDGSISYFARIYNQTKVALMELDDVDKVWNETSSKVKESVSSPSFAFVVNCLARSQMFEKMNRFDDFSENLKNMLGKFIGISGYGEQLNNISMNETMVLVVFE